MNLPINRSPKGTDLRLAVSIVMFFLVPVIVITSGLYKNYPIWKRTLNVDKTKWRLLCIKHRAVESLFIFSLSATLRFVSLTTVETLCSKVLSYFALKFFSLSLSRKDLESSPLPS